MKIVNLAEWGRKKSYEWFLSFSNPTYHLSSKIDITALINLKNKYNRSFFEDMLYLTIKGLNAVAEMRLRIVNGQIIEYDTPSPSFTVAMGGGTFDLCRVNWDENPAKFCKAVRNGIEQTIKLGSNKGFEDSSLNVYYFTCLPWLDFESMSDPIPDDIQSLSVPRICWGKYGQEDGKYKISMNITVNHALVDGKPLCDAFIAIQNTINDCEKLLIK